MRVSSWRLLCVRLRVGCESLSSTTTTVAPAELYETSPRPYHLMAVDSAEGLAACSEVGSTRATEANRLHAEA
jgi:hypothetical protein